MAQISKHMLTMAETVKRTNNDRLVEIAELLEEKNEILDDLQLVEASNVTTHRTTQRTGLARGDWRAYNQGVGNAVTSTRQIDEDVATLAIYSEVDKQLAQQSGNPSAFRKSEDTGIIEGLSQQMAETLIYGNRKTNPAMFTGLAPRRNETSHPQVYDAGGTGSDLTSIYVVQHGTRGFHGIYPRGSNSVGINVEDKGEQTAFDEDGKKLQVYRTLFEWAVGIVIRDPETVFRIANVPVDMGEDYEQMKKWEYRLIEVLNQMPNRGTGAVIYGNKDIMTQADIKALDRHNVQYGSTEIFGREVTTFRGTPMRLVERILSTEDQVPESA